MDKPLWQYHFTDWQAAVRILDSLAWNLSWKERNGRWRLWTGDQALFVGDTEGELQAFLCGMALGLAVLPESILDQIRQIASE
jgi:hypothetical protein